ncbi:MAG: ATP-dependent DNA helicase RecG [Vicingaceae bacterium]|nr:MAG: ATP-dependent DNA helicase RecG [Vicingaceae bacterium]
MQKPFDEILKTPIEYLKGVGPERSKWLKSEAGIEYFEDLLNYFPLRYEDRTRLLTIDKITEDLKYVQFTGKLISKNTVGDGSSKRLVAEISDGTGTVELVWFKGLKWIDKILTPGKYYLVFGRPNFFKWQISIPHPEIELINSEKEVIDKMGLQPVYSTSEKLIAKGLNSKSIGKLTLNLIEKVYHQISENLPSWVIRQYDLMPRNEAYKQIHHPENEALLNQAKKRLKYEELFFLQLMLLKIKHQRNSLQRGFVFHEVGELFNRFYREKLPFELTGAQKRVIKEIRKDTLSGLQMNRLLQGDVGSGKTVVALMSMLLAIDNGYQAALMAPTEILAQQHYKTISGMLQGLPVNVGLLTGSTKQSERRRLFSSLIDGSLNILIGTHALLEEKVEFKNLGFVVIDEQHKFGVEQRSKMFSKNSKPPHLLVMSATPIPRTLAMTIYGDMDVSVLDELPPGRKEVITVHRYENRRANIYEFIRSELQKGRQAYIVFPLIEESEALDLKSLQEGYEQLEKIFPFPLYRIGMVHGKMDPVEKEYNMKKFASGEIQLLVSTTVIEVGVDVPNASVMVIEHAERFGLSQLHQLRGRVGRGNDQAYCILVTSSKLTEDARKRIQAMVSTNDGFKIAEIDMEIRGPGDIMGTRQSGMLKFKIANLLTDQLILEKARKDALQLIQSDPHLSNPEHQSTANWLSYIKSQHEYLNVL